MRLQREPGARVRASGYLLLVSRGDDATARRLGIVASRKVGNAVERNRAKRLVRELFRTNKTSLPAGFDYVFVALPGLADATLASLQAELPRVLGDVRRRTRDL